MRVKPSTHAQVMHAHAPLPRWKKCTGKVHVGTYPAEFKPAGICEKVEAAAAVTDLPQPGGWILGRRVVLA